jgi:hypothetical protein
VDTRVARARLMTAIVLQEWDKDPSLIKLNARAPKTQLLPLNQDLIEGMTAARQVVDVSFKPSRDRLRQLEFDPITEDLAVTAKIARAADRLPVNPIVGQAIFERGYWCSFLAGRMLPWMGEAAFEYCELLETTGEHDDFATEPFELHWRHPYTREKVFYTPDFELLKNGRTIRVVEVKRDYRDLLDSEYRLKLACAAEIFRRIGWRFDVVLRSEIFESRTHRNNVELFAMRRFVTPGPHHLKQLAKLAATGTRTTYGALVKAVEPDLPLWGEAVVQSLQVRRMVQVDLTQKLTASTPALITLH